MNKKYSLSDIKGPFFPCPISEQETVIQISRDGKEAHITTNDLTMLTRLKRAASQEGSQWRLIEIQYMRGFQCQWGFACPKKFVSFRSKNLSKKILEGLPFEEEAEPIEEAA